MDKDEEIKDVLDYVAGEIMAKRLILLECFRVPVSFENIKDKPLKKEVEALIKHGIEAGRFMGIASAKHK